MRKVLVDIHSYGVDVYSSENSKIVLLLKKEIPFLENYKVDRGFHFNDEESLVRLMERLATNYFDCKVEAYAREIFEELPRNYFDEIASEVYKRSKIEIKLETESRQQSLER
jgi:hypothetical protein